LPSSQRTVHVHWYHGPVSWTRYHKFRDYTPGKNVPVIVYKPDKTPLNELRFGEWSGGSCDLSVLPANGTYTVWVDNGTWATTLTLVECRCDWSLTINGPAKVFTTARVGQNARYTFAGAFGQGLSLVLSGDTFPVPPSSVCIDPMAITVSTSVYYASGTGSSRTLNLNNLPSPERTLSLSRQVT